MERFDRDGDQEHLERDEDGQTRIADMKVESFIQYEIPSKYSNLLDFGKTAAAKSTDLGALIDRVGPSSSLAEKDEACRRVAAELASAMN